MAAAIIPAALSAIPAVGKLLGIGGSSGQDPQKNALRQQQLQQAESAALAGDPQAAAELESWNRPGPSNAEAQQFIAQHPQVGQEAMGTSFSGNYGQSFANPGQGVIPSTGSAGGIGQSLGGIGGSAVGGVGNPNSLLSTANAGVGAYDLAKQQDLMNQALSSVTSAYNAKQPLRQEALAGLENTQGPNLSSVFASDNPFARSAPGFQSGNTNALQAATQTPQQAAQSLTSPSGPAGQGVTAATQTPTAPGLIPGGTGLGSRPMIPYSALPPAPPTQAPKPNVFA